MNKTVKTVAAILVVALLTVGIVYGITYILQLSNTQEVDVTSGVVYVPVTLTVNSTSLTDLDTLNLTATTGINGAGKTVTFYDNGTSIGSAVLAELNGGIYAAVLLKSSLTIGHHNFTAGP